MADVYVTVRRNRHNIIPVKLSYSVADDTLVSVIRKGRDSNSVQIAEWTIEKVDGDGTEFNLIMTESVATAITDSIGYFDIKRTLDDKDYSIFDTPMQVRFVDVVTT